MAAKPSLTKGRSTGQYVARRDKKPTFGSNLVRSLNKPGIQRPSGPQAPAPAAPPADKPGVPAPAPQKAEPDSGYNQAIDRTNRREQSSLGQLDTAEGAVKRDFGIDDPTDPFSRANALKKTFLARGKAASASLASQGQLYSGTHERALDRTRTQEEAARSDLRKTYEAAINQIGAQRAGVKFGSEEERAQAFEDWLARAPEADVTAEEAQGGGAATADDPNKVTALKTDYSDAKPVPGVTQPSTAGLTSGEAKRINSRNKKVNIARNALVQKKTEEKRQAAAKAEALKPGGAAKRPAARAKPKPHARAVAHRGGRIR